MTRLTRTPLLLQLETDRDLEEGLKKKLAGLAVGAACMLGSPGCASQQANTPTRPQQTIQQRPMSDAERIIARERAEIRGHMRTVASGFKKLKGAADVPLKAARSLPRMDIRAPGERPTRRSTNQDFYRALSR